MFEFHPYLLVSIAAALAVSACNSSPEACEGSEGCDCYQNDTCNDGLTCAGNTVCVVMDADLGDTGGSSSSGGASSSGGSSSGGRSSGGASSSGGSSSGGSSSGGASSSGGSSSGGSSSGGASSSGGSSSGGASSSGGGSSGGASSSGGSSSGGGSGGVSSSGGSSSGGDSGGASSGGGSGGVSSGGVSSSGGSGSDGSGGGNVNPNLIDDFSDCDDAILEVGGRNGVWYYFGVGDLSYTAGVPDASWGDQSCGVFLNGSCADCDAAGLGVILDDGAYDLSNYSGIRVTYESEANINVAVKTTNGINYGYAWSQWITPTGTSSGVRSIYFADLQPDSNFHGLEWAQEIHFAIHATDRGGFGIGIHRLELIP